MDAELKRLWTDALRSGEYEQGIGFLHYTENGINKWCCLGVLYDVAVDGWWEPSAAGQPRFPKADDTFIWKPTDGDHGDRSQYYFGESLIGGYSIMQNLASKNDAPSSFAEIADWIDENL